MFAESDRKYNASGIHPSVCSEEHFTIRLVDHMNRTGDHAGPVVWGAVIGLSESFTFAELMLFPVYVLRNHGSVWNEQSWTIWLTVLIFAPLVLVVVRGVMRFLGIPVLESMPFSMRWSNGQRIPTLIWRPENPRVPLYELAVLAFVATMIENFIHLNIAAQGTNAYDWGYWVGLFVVILFANGLPLASAHELGRDRIPQNRARLRE